METSKTRADFEKLLAAKKQELAIREIVGIVLALILAISFADPEFHAFITDVLSEEGAMIVCFMVWLNTVGISMFRVSMIERVLQKLDNSKPS